MALKSPTLALFRGATHGFHKPDSQIDEALNVRVFVASAGTYGQVDPEVIAYHAEAHHLTSVCACVNEERKLAQRAITILFLA